MDAHGRWHLGSTKPADERLVALLLKKGLWYFEHPVEDV
jgi:hypothetical protein